jgi:hypothetical protein
MSGPILIFDKSALESLNPDESVWLDNFFQSNITPLFFIETLADLEKQVHAGRTPEQVVGNLAYKTPDMQSRPNVHHARLLNAELSGAGPVEMDGRGIISGGKPVVLEGQTGIVFQRTQEEEAFHRWQRQEFLDVERLVAKGWRRALTSVNYDQAYANFQKWFPGGAKPRSLSDVKFLADAKLGESDRESCFRFGLSLLGIVPSRQEQFVTRWQDAGRPAVREFAPYFAYVLSVELFFYLALSADLVSRDRPSNKIDFAYLYYLPFCRIFTSNDALHERVVPLFLRADQTFVKGTELKADFGRLDQHYSSLSKEVRNQGLFHFAAYPPLDPSFLTTQLWDKHMPNWRKNQENSKPLSEDLQRVLMDLVKRIEKDSVPARSTQPIGFGEAAYVHMQQKAHFKKGKWNRFPPEVAAT